MRTANDNEALKYCPVCWCDKSRIDFHKNRTAHDGLQSTCKSCCGIRAVLKRTKEKVSRNAVKDAQMETWRRYGKACFTCGRTLHLQEFTADATKASGCRGTCKECERPRRQESRNNYYKKNAMKVKDKVSNYRVDNAERIRVSRLTETARQRKDLSDRYVRKLLAERCQHLKELEIPVELVEVKRQHLLLLRKLKELQE